VVTPIVPLTVQVAVAVVQLHRRPLGTPSTAQIWSIVVGGSVVVVVV
jgi:hypothetical protein